MGPYTNMLEEERNFSCPKLTLSPDVKKWLKPMVALLFTVQLLSHVQGLQHTRLPCPSLSPRVCSNSHPLDGWCHPTISSCFPLPLLPSIFSGIRVFPMSWFFATGGQTIGASALVLPVNISGLISFRIDRFDLPAAQGTRQESSPASQFKIINSSVLSLLYGPTLIYVHDSWKNHSFHYTELCW